MSIIFDGDWKSTSRALYGTDRQSLILQDAYPGAVVGDEITKLETRSYKESLNLTTPKSVAVLINGDIFDKWISVTYTQSIEGFGQVTLTTPNENETRTLFAPFSFSDLALYIDNKLALSGFLVNIAAESSASGDILSLQAYTKCAILSDVTSVTLPAEFKEAATLETISNKLCKPFGIDANVSDGGAPFKRVRLEPGQKIASFLIGLAKQRGLIVTNSKDGSLLIKKAAQKKTPVASFSSQSPSVTQVNARFNGQSVFDSITAILPKKKGKDGSRITEKTGLGKKRPDVFIAQDAQNVADAQKALVGRRARMYGSSITYSVSTPILTANDDLWRPDTYLTLDNENVYCKKASLLIKSVQYDFSLSGQKVNLSLTVPEAFTGDKIGGIPWV